MPQYKVFLPVRGFQLRIGLFTNSFPSPSGYPGPLASLNLIDVKNCRKLF